MSKVNCVNCKYYDYNTSEDCDWCKLYDTQTGCCGHCERDFEDLEDATENYNAIEQDNEELLRVNANPVFATSKLQSQLEHQKEMWETLKNFIGNRPYFADYDVQEHGMKVITDIIDKMQELEETKDDNY